MSEEQMNGRPQASEGASHVEDATSASDGTATRADARKAALVRAERLSPERRSEIARFAACKRWEEANKSGDKATQEKAKAEIDKLLPAQQKNNEELGWAIEIDKHKKVSDKEF